MMKPKKITKKYIQLTKNDNINESTYESCSQKIIIINCRNANITATMKKERNKLTKKKRKHKTMDRF